MPVCRGYHGTIYVCEGGARKCYGWNGTESCSELLSGFRCLCIGSKSRLY